MQLRGQDLLISAAAGSGKTATLTERIIRALTGTAEDGSETRPADITRMLIVTFTRAAAAELRSRISAALSAAIAAQPDNHHLYRQLLALGSADICTIDSFYLQPVRANFERLGLPPSFRLADEGELAPLKHDTLQRLIDAAYTRYVPADADENTPLSVLRGNAFARAMDDIMPNRDRGENTQVLLSLYEKLLAFPEGLDCLAHSASRLESQADLPFAQTDHGRSLISVIVQKLDSLQGRIDRACAVFAADPVAANIYLPCAQGDLETVCAIRLALHNGQWDNAGDILRAFAPMRLGSSRKEKAGPEALSDKEDRTAWVKDIRALSPFFADDATTRREHMLQTASTERLLHELLSDYDREIRQIKLRRGIQDFTDVRRALLRLLLDEDGNLTDVARSLQDKYDAVYIDEYQDVDTVQDTIFSIIGAGGKRFMVGDIKQSIYAFRGAEPSIFADYRRRFSTVTPEQPDTDGNGACLFMSENFRCDRSVIDLTNAVCGYTFSLCKDSIAYTRADDLICGKQPDPATPSHPAHIFLLEKAKDDTTKDEDDEEDGDAPLPVSASPRTKAINPEAVCIAREIYRLTQSERKNDGTPIRPRDIAILMRLTSMAEALTEALAAYGIPTTYQTATSLSAHPDMIELINLLSVIDNPRDDVPLTALLTSPASPLTLQHLLQLRTSENRCLQIPLYDVLCLAADGTLTAEHELRDRCATVVSFVQRWQSVARTLPVDKFLRKLYGEPFLKEKASSPVYLTVYDKARHYQNTSFCGLYQFLRYFRRLLENPSALNSTAATPADTDAVTLLSIHGSKGLEFPVVWIANCAAAFSSKDQRAPIMFDHALGAAARIYDPSDASRRESIVRLALAEQLRVRQREEEMRILYVAMTRARERLYISAKLRSQAKTLLDYADRPTKDDRCAVLAASNYISWIMSALSSTNRDPNLPECYQIHIEDRRSYTADTLPASVPTPVEAPQGAESSDAAFYRAVLEEHRRYRDENALLRTLPTKAAASKLTRGMLDRYFLPEMMDGSEPLPPEQKAQDEADRIRHRIELMRAARPSFHELLERREQADAAERGTATHLFLQYCDYTRLAAHGVEDEIARLVCEKYLTSRTAALLNRRHLQNFVKSPLFQDVLAAKQVWRELQFNRFLPYSTLTERADMAQQLGDASLYVQGSLDLLLLAADGTLTLCDYKTDRLRTEDFGADIDPASRQEIIQKQLIRDHGDQLTIYADAVRGMFGKYPDRICIYSLPLGCAVDMPVPTEKSN
jgi:ATP-dependent helicase/nuclease subunit A